jgi:hypothetical protein
MTGVHDVGSGVDDVRIAGIGIRCVRLRVDGRIANVAGGVGVGIEAVALGRILRTRRGVVDVYATADDQRNPEAEQAAHD